MIVMYFVFASAVSLVNDPFLTVTMYPTTCVETCIVVVGPGCNNLYLGYRYIINRAVFTFKFTECKYR